MSRASRAARWLAFGNRMKASAERRRVRSCQFVRLRIRARFPTRPSSLMRRRRPCRPRRQPKALSALQLSMSTSSSFSASIRARPTTGAPACRPRRRLRNSGAEKCTMRNPDRGSGGRVFKRAMRSSRALKPHLYRIAFILQSASLCSDKFCFEDFHNSNLHIGDLGIV